jgi:hypothetical protein
MRNAAAITVLLVGLTGAAQARATELTSEAARGFQTYTQHAEDRMQREIKSGAPFLWKDTLPEQQRHEVEAQLERGQAVSERVENKDSPEKTPGAKIHHWIGTVFIPGATLKQALFLAQDYDEHAKYFQPQVLRSKLESHSGDDFKIYMRLKQTKILTVVFDTNHNVHYTYLDPTHAYSISRTTRVAEVEHPGAADEYTMPVGNDHGFLWRLNSYWRFYQTGRGVYVQCEAISLSRDIPTGLNFLLGHFIEGIARDSLEFTLRSTRTAALDNRFRGIQ